MPSKEVSYPVLPEGVDIVDFLFGKERFVVKQSDLKPKDIVRLYEQMMQLVKVKDLQAKNEQYPYGLESLPGMLRHEPGLYGEKWLTLKANKKIIQAGLPVGTPYQLQYLKLFDFVIPDWKNIPVDKVKVSWGKSNVLSPISSEALLVGRNQKLYLAQALWVPDEQYLHNDSPNRNHLYVFSLANLSMRQIEWNSNALSVRIKEGQWSDIFQVVAGVQLVLRETANVLRSKMKRLDFVNKKLQNLPVHYCK